MKIRYLPEHHRQALHQLRGTDDIDRIAQILSDALRRPLSVQALFEYRKWLRMLSSEQLQKDAMLCVGLAHVLAMEGEGQRAEALLEQLPDDDAVVLAAKLAMPTLSFERRMQVIDRLVASPDYRPTAGMLLTAARPSIINGAWDWTANIDELLRDKEQTMLRLQQLYGDPAQDIFELAQAETLYYRDKCYEALITVVSKIPFLRERGDMRLLFMALTLEIFIMVKQRQTPSTVPMIENLRRQISSAGMEEYIPNIDALEAWSAMYDGDYTRLSQWMRDGAPDEYGRFCTLDIFRYMVKMRAYIIQGKHLAVTALAHRLLPLLQASGRYMDQCELHLLWAMSDHADGRTQQALGHLQQALELSERYHYDRLIADEGPRIYELLMLYCNEQTRSPYLMWVSELARDMAAHFPRYLKNQLPEAPALTPAEMRVLHLLAENMSNVDIAGMLHVGPETVKTHCRNLFNKLQVKKRTQAVQRAIEFGILKSAAHTARRF